MRRRGVESAVRMANMQVNRVRIRNQESNLENLEFYKGIHKCLIEFLHYLFLLTNKSFKRGWVAGTAGA
jgi:hypothetical protein